MNADLMGMEPRPLSGQSVGLLAIKDHVEKQKKPEDFQEMYLDTVTEADEEHDYTSEAKRLLSEDMEAQHLSEKHPITDTAAAPEHFVPTRTKLIALGLYFLCNVGLTLYNKAVLGSFHFPWLLTALHAGSASVGCYFMMLRGYFKLTSLGSREHFALVAFSFLFTINIAISNVSLAMVSIPFHQVMRATCPLITTLIYRVYYSRSYARATYLSLAPVVLGVTFATYGDYSYTSLGFILTFLGVILAAVKTVVTNRLMTGSLALPPLEFLFRMSPLAFIQSLICAMLSGEVTTLLSATKTVPYPPTMVTAYAVGPTVLVLLGNGALAFFLNISSFTTNKLVGALTMTVCANVKQCLTIALGVILWNLQVGFLNATGLVITTFGAAVYSFVELDSKGKSAAVRGVRV